MEAVDSWVMVDPPFFFSLFLSLTDSLFLSLAVFVSISKVVGCETGQAKKEDKKGWLEMMKLPRHVHSFDLKF